MTQILTCRHQRQKWLASGNNNKYLGATQYFSPGQKSFPSLSPGEEEKYSKIIGPCSSEQGPFSFPISTLFPFSFSLLSLPKRRNRRKRKWLYSLICHSFSFFLRRFVFLFFFPFQERRRSSFFSFLFSFFEEEKEGKGRRKRENIFAFF